MTVLDKICLFMLQSYLQIANIYKYKQLFYEFYLTLTIQGKTHL